MNSVNIEIGDKYIYEGGNQDHRYRGFVCTIGWKFDTSNVYMVYFDENIPSGLGFEMAQPHELKKIE